MSDRLRYCVVGTGGRSAMYLDALCNTHKDRAELVAMCDTSQTRMGYHRKRLTESFGAPEVACYDAKDFDAMVRATKPDGVIVCTPDALHAEYLVRAMNLGVDAISEKPLTTTVKGLEDIFKAIETSGRNLRVTFNCRYMPPMALVKKMIMEGVVGSPCAIDLQWVLNTSHGADYFRRWHRLKEMSGGLLVHKSTHHFDLCNWWVDSYPQKIYCQGDLKFYGKAAAARGEAPAYERYTGQATEGDPFAIDIAKDARMKALYYDAEGETGYVRDRNVFNDDINIEDTISISGRYRNGVVLNYSLVAYSPWEGFRMAVTGTRGRLEFNARQSVHIIAKEGDDPEAVKAAAAGGAEIKVFPMFGMPYDVEVPKGEGSHGGGDQLLLDDLFSRERRPDPLHQVATHLDGAASAMLGITANESIARGQAIVVDDLFPLK